MPSTSVVGFQSSLACNESKVIGLEIFCSTSAFSVEVVVVELLMPSDKAQSSGSLETSYFISSLFKVVVLVETTLSKEGLFSDWITKKIPQMSKMIRMI